MDAIGNRSYRGRADNRRNGDGRRRKVRNTDRSTRYVEPVSSKPWENTVPVGR